MPASPTKLTSVRFTVPAVPVAQPRQRHRIVNSHGKAFVHNYTPSKSPVQDFKATVRLAARGVYGGPPADEPLALYVTFVMPRPAAKIWKTKPMERYPHTAKPDMDNLVKSLKDSLHGLLWRDDSLVCVECLSKYVASGDEQPHVDVAVRTLSDFEKGE